MRTHLAIAVFFAVVLPINGQEKGPEPGGNQQTSYSAEKSSSPPHQTIQCEVKNDGTAIECKWPQAVPNGYLKRLASPENAPNIGLFFVGLGGVLAAVFTLIAINKQARLMERQLDSMNLQAQIADKQMALMFRKERGTLVIKGHGIEIKDGPKRSWNLIGEIKLTNSGNLPLRVFAGAGECLVLKIGEYAPQLHSQNLQKIGLPNTWIRPNDNGLRENLWSDEIPHSKTVFAQMLAKTEVRIFLRGTIDYESHGSAWRRFYCFTWISSESSGVAGITHGQWVEDSEQENDEYDIPAPLQCPF